MIDLLAARSQMAVSLGFHIIFACIGIAMPFFMAVAHWKWLRTGQQVYLELTRAWLKGVAIFFAIGAVSGTVLSFELGLLFPKFMEVAGPIIGLPFSLEGVAFFLEAIALGFFIYGWNTINRWVHWASGVIMGIAGAVSGLIVICANGWMNSPAGFDWVDNQAINIDPFAAMLNNASLHQGIHMTIAAFAATGFAVAGIHAFLLLKNKNIPFHQAAVKIALIFGATASLLQPISGDFISRHLTEHQPEKAAAMHAQFKTQKGAPLLIGGIPLEKEKTVKFGIYIPGMLSLLAHHDFNAEVTGLDAFPEENHPPVAVVHFAFQTMVGIGIFLVGLSALYFLFVIKKPHLVFHSLYLKCLVFAIPLGFIAVQAGWVVTEVGRQPWIIYRIMKVSEAVTPMPGLIIPFLLFTGIYILLSFVAVWLLLRQIKAVKT